MTETVNARRALSSLTLLFGLTFLESVTGIILILLTSGESLIPHRLIAVFPPALLSIISAWGVRATFPSENEIGIFLNERFHSPAGFPRLFLAIFLTAAGVLLMGILVLPQTFLRGFESSAYAIGVLCGLSALIAFEWFAVWWSYQRKAVPAFPLRHLGPLLAVLVFLTAVLVRLPLSGYALPYQNVWDEVVAYTDALRLFTEPGMKPAPYVPAYGTSGYGDLLTYIAFAGEAAGYFSGLRSGEIHSVSEFISPPQGTSIYEAVHPSGIPLLYPRLLILLINSLAPVFIFFILRKFFRVHPWLSFGAALIYAAFSREVLYYSSFILPDALATTVTALLFLTVLQTMQSGGNRWLPWFACGMLSGMVVSINIRNLLVVFVPILALLLAWRKGTNLRLIPIPLLGAMAGFALTSPYSLLDFPAYIRRISSLSWSLNSTLPHRAASLVFYLRAVFAPGFESSYVEPAGASVGFGILVGILAVIGVYRGIVRFPRPFLLVLFFCGAQLFFVLPVIQNYSRHILILYPLVCVLAGLGLAQLAALLRNRLDQSRETGRPAWGHLAPGIVLAAFLLLHSGQLVCTARYVQSTTAFRPSQVQAADYLLGILHPGDVVGIQAGVPFAENYLVQHGIAYRRVSAADTIADLQAAGITYVIGTDHLGADYLAAAPLLWEGFFQAPGATLASFGKDTLEALGYPVADLYLFVGRVPGT
jgi:hypothetical protein